MNERFIKITNAVYKTLEFFPESDPLKNKAKEKALEILENLSAFGKEHSEEHNWSDLKSVLLEQEVLIKSNIRNPEKVLENIEILLSYLNLAKLQGWLSSVNFLIISNEYERISGAIRKEDLKFDEMSRNQAQERTVQKQENNASEPIKTDPDIKKEIIALSKNQGQADNDISDRQKKILEVLKQKEKAQVMDLKIVLGSITKRTIRRDIDDLLKKGRIIRVGEWNQVFYKLS